MKTTKLAKVMSVGLAVSMLSSLAACTGANETSEMTTIPSQIATEPTETEENVPYTYGLGKTFHADQPVTYTMFLMHHGIRWLRLGRRRVFSRTSKTVPM